MTLDNLDNLDNLTPNDLLFSTVSQPQNLLKRTQLSYPKSHFRRKSDLLSLVWSHFFPNLTFPNTATDSPSKAHRQLSPRLYSIPSSPDL
ncbi:hypothetical protein P9112_009984 [Eukaryota sp. TZLM1-RC]